MKGVSARSIDDFRSFVIDTTGNSPDCIVPGKLHRFSTREQRLSDNSGFCKLFDDLRAGFCGDFRRGGERAIWKAGVYDRMAPALRGEIAQQVREAQAARQVEQARSWSRNRARNAALLAESRPVACNDPVARYLRRRGFERLWPMPACLRFHPSLAYCHDDGSLTTHPGMVAPVVDDRGEVVTVHRTYLTPGGHKAHVPSPKKLMPKSGYLEGASIPLFPAAAGLVGVAEGIETALAACCASGVPTVASTCAGLMATWRWPAGVQLLVIFADHDRNRAGQDAADTLRARALTARLQCEVLTPTTEGTDWCDVWTAGGAVTIASGAAA